MEIRDVVSVLSVMVALVAAGLAWEAISRQTRTQKWLANHQILMKANDMIIQDNNLIEILGIDLEAVVRDGLSVKELVFINTHLDASSVLWRIAGGTMHSESCPLAKDPSSLGRPAAPFSL